MSRINDILSKLDLDADQTGTLSEALGGLDEAAQELLLEGIRTKRRAKIGPEIEAFLARIFESEPWTTMEAVADGIGRSMPATRGAFATLTRDGKVAIFKNVRRDGRRLVFPAGTSRAQAEQLNGQESNLRPFWSDALEFVRKAEVDGLPTTVDLAAHLGCSVSKAASTVGVMTQYGWFESTDITVDGRRIITTPDADIEEVATRAALKDVQIKKARKAAKAS